MYKRMETNGFTVDQFYGSPYDTCSFAKYVRATFQVFGADQFWRNVRIQSRRRQFTATNNRRDSKVSDNYVIKYRHERNTEEQTRTDDMKPDTTNVNTSLEIDNCNEVPAKDRTQRRQHCLKMSFRGELESFLTVEVKQSTLPLNDEWAWILY